MPRPAETTLSASGKGISPDSFSVLIISVFGIEFSFLISIETLFFGFELTPRAFGTSPKIEQFELLQFSSIPFEEKELLKTVKGL